MSKIIIVDFEDKEWDFFKIEIKNKTIIFINKKMTRAATRIKNENQ